MLTNINQTNLNMNTFINQIYEEFEARDKKFTQHKKENIAQSKEMIHWMGPKIEELNQFLKTYEFGTNEEEIHFFKYIKPKIMSRFMFYKEVLRMEVAKPPSKILQSKYYENELERNARYFKREYKIYEYYRANAIELDVFYFTRIAQKNILETECFEMNIEPRITTCYDFKLAKIMATEAIETFIENQITYLNAPTDKHESPFVSKWHWSGSKTDLTELIYALHSKKIINNGNTDIMELATDLGKLLNIELNQTIYRNYTDIKSRKITKTKFLDSLSESLSNKIIEEELKL